MRVVKAGKFRTYETGEFFFHCSNCECEWWANRTDKSVFIAPPGWPFDVYCDCPNCEETSSYKYSIKFMKKGEQNAN